MDRGGGRKKFYSRPTIMFPEYWDWFQSPANDSMNSVEISRSDGQGGGEGAGRGTGRGCSQSRDLLTAPTHARRAKIHPHMRSLANIPLHILAFGWSRIVRGWSKKRGTISMTSATVVWQNSTRESGKFLSESKPLVENSILRTKGKWWQRKICNIFRACPCSQRTYRGITRLLNEVALYTVHFISWWTDL